MATAATATATETFHALRPPMPVGNLNIIEISAANSIHSMPCKNTH